MLAAYSPLMNLWVREMNGPIGEIRSTTTRAELAGEDDFYPGHALTFPRLSSAMADSICQNAAP
jgi:hypothetical protein